MKPNNPLLHRYLRSPLAGVLALVPLALTGHAANVNWLGTVNDDWTVGLNWDNNTGPIAGDHIYIDPGSVEFSSGTSPNFRSVRLLDGAMTVSGGYLQASFNASQHCRVNGTLLHTGGTVDWNELEVGSNTGDTGLYQLAGGDLLVARGLNGFSLYLGGNHDSNAGGTGTMQISAGSLTTRTGVKLGHATVAGTGTFEVIGSWATTISIGTQGSGDGWWEQNSGSTLKVRVDPDGLTPVFIDDVEGTNGTYATFESGALLDVGYSNHGGPGTWTVMKVENGDITDNGLAFAPGVDTGIWSFNIDNSGAHGLLTVTSTAAAPTTGEIDWNGSVSSDWNDGANWDNGFGPVTSGDRARIDSGTVEFTAANGVNLRALRLYGGTLTISEGLFKATSQSSWDSRVNGTLYHTGGTVQINELEVGGRSASNNGFVYVSGGDTSINRGLNGYSLYLGADHDNNNGGTGLFEISGGSLQTRTGVKLGDATMSGTGTFAVLGADIAEIGIAARTGDNDGIWTQHSGSTLKVGVDHEGLTPIFLHDSASDATGTSATFESGALLEVGYHDNGSEGGTWTVMEVENGTITDNGLAFAPGVDTGIWSFNIDNTGANGLLTVTSTASPGSEVVTWVGTDSSAWALGSNWDNGTGPYTKGDRVVINSGTVVYNEASTPNLNAVRQFGGTMVISGGVLNANNNTNWDSRINGTTYHIAGTADFNELEIGSHAGETGFYYLAGGDLVGGRALNGNSLYLGGNHDGNAGGTGTLEITSGSLRTRTGVKLGHASQPGTGTFAVLGTAASEIGIGSHNSLDGTWEQHAGSTLRVGIDYTGVTRIFIDDVEGVGGTSATFESGALLDVDYYNAGSGGGTWTVMEVENGDIIDNGLAFAPGVDTGTWSFSIDNSGANGVLRVTATGVPAGPVLTVGNTLNQQMRYGIDYERLWFWTGGLNETERARVAEWSVVDCDVDYVRVAMNSGYELTENVFDLSAYTNKIIPMMEKMQAANPEVKFFASPRPLNEAVSGASWQPYPLWVTGATTYTSGDYDFDDIKCSEYLIKYLLLMKSYGFQITYLDVTNEWQSNHFSGGRVAAGDVRDIAAEFQNYLAAPWEHPDYPGITLTADDIPQIVASSAWAYDEASSWIATLNNSAKKDAVNIASAHNTDKAGTAQDFVDAVNSTWSDPGDTVPEIWNTEVHGWKSTSNADEVLTFAFMMECINAGFSGLSGWLAIGTTNQGHSYILNPSGSPSRNVKYYMFEKLTNTSHRGHALDVNEPAEFDADSLDADASVSATLRGNLMTVWVLNHSDTDHPVTINPTGRTISEFPVKVTRWSEVDGLALEGETEKIPSIGGTSFYSVARDNSAYCFELLLEPEVVPYTRIEAESFDGSNPGSHSTESCSDTGGGLNLSDINDGNWVRFDDVLLSGATSMRFRIAAPSGRPDGVIEVRTGSESGPVIGRTAIPVTGGWQDWETIETPIDLTSGTHDVFLKFVEAGSNQSGSGAMFNLNWFEVQIAESPDNLAGAPVTDSQVDLSWDAVDGAIGYTLKRSTTPGGPYTVVDDTLTTTSFSDMGLSAGTPYHYVVVTRYDGFESAESAEITVVPSNPVVIEDVVFSSAVVSGTNFEFSILNSQLGHNHQAQESDSLVVPDWQDVGSVQPGNGGVLPFSIPMGSYGPGHFFRVIIWRQ